MNRSEVQPYFRAFMVERGYHDSTEATNLDYLMWNGERWREFDAIMGRKVPGMRSAQEREAFGDWLERRSASFLEGAPSPRPQHGGGAE